MADQPRVRYHDNPTLRTHHGDDCVLLVWYHGELIEAEVDGDALVLTPDAARDLAQALSDAVTAFDEHQKLGAAADDAVKPAEDDPPKDDKDT